MSSEGPNDGSSSILPDDLFDTTTLASLAATVVLLGAAYAASLRFLSYGSSGALRTLFVWHAFDALIHFFLEGSFLYHCFFSWVALEDAPRLGQPLHQLAPTPFNWLGTGSGRIYGAQAGGDNPFAQLWMVYSKADKRWAAPDLTVVSLELLTVFGAGPLAVYICYLIVKQDFRAYLWMIVVATAEIYGGWMTFCPEWLTGNINLDTSNWMYLWLYLIFFNTLWVWMPLYAIYISWSAISNAFRCTAEKKKQ